MVKSNRYLSLRKSSALSQDKNFHDAVVASTMLRVNAGLGYVITAFGKQVNTNPLQIQLLLESFPL